MLLAKYEFDEWFHFFKKQGIIKKKKKKDLPKNLMMLSNVHEWKSKKVNQGLLYDINVLFNRSSETKLHPILVRQYGHLNCSNTWLICWQTLFLLGVLLVWNQRQRIQS